jgi:hypothetical protein
MSDLLAHRPIHRPHRPSNNTTGHDLRGRGRLETSPLCRVDRVDGAPDVVFPEVSQAHVADSCAVGLVRRIEVALLNVVGELEFIVVVEEPQQDLVSSHVARCRFAAGEEAHDVGIAVKVEQVVHIGLGQPTQHQSFGFQEDLHRSTLPTPTQHGQQS